MTSLIELMQQNAIAQQAQQAAQQQQHADMMNSLINHQAAQTAHAQNVAAAAAAPGLGPRRNDGERLVAKFFQCQQFSGKPEHWSDFAFRFKRAARSQSNEVYRMLVEAETAEDRYDVLGDDAENPELSGTLYDVLCQHVEGEGFMVLKSMSAERNGFEAWNKLFNKYNPTTFARGLQLLTKVVNPGRLKNYNEVESGIVLWEEKVAQLQSQFGEGLTDKLKTAILINAMPVGIQDQVFQQMSKEASYSEIKMLIKRFAARKMESNGPTPMDVGNLQTPGGPWSGEPSGPWSGEQCMSCGNEGCPPQCQGYGEDYGWQEEVPWQEDHSNPFQDINGIQDAICYSCVGKGHIAPNCPSKGKGKGYQGTRVRAGDAGKSATSKASARVSNRTAACQYRERKRQFQSNRQAQ